MADGQHSHNNNTINGTMLSYRSWSNLSMTVAFHANTPSTSSNSRNLTKSKSIQWRWVWLCVAVWWVRMSNSFIANDSQSFSANGPTLVRHSLIVAVTWSSTCFRYCTLNLRTRSAYVCHASSGERTGVAECRPAASKYSSTWTEHSTAKRTLLYQTRHLIPQNDYLTRWTADLWPVSPTSIR